MINAIILLNDELDNVSDCDSYQTCKSAHTHKTNQNLFFLLSVSIPRPLFPIAGYPLIYHHIRALSEVQQVQHVFLIGKYDPKKFYHFVDDVLSEFSFKTIQYIQDDTPKNEAGVLFKYRERILQDSPDYLFMMRYRICCSFPLHDIINFHREKERQMDIFLDRMKDNQKFMEDPENHNLALVTAVSYSIDPEEKHKNHGCFAMDSKTQEMLHYAENAQVELSNNINCGIYFISVRLFTEFGLQAYPSDNGTSDQGFSGVDHLTNGGLNIDQDNVSLSNQCFTPRELANSTKSGSDFVKSYVFVQNAQFNQIPEFRYQQYSQGLMYLNSMEDATMKANMNALKKQISLLNMNNNENITDLVLTMKDLFMPMCSKKKIFIFEMDKTKEFFKQLNRHEEKLSCQNMYFQHYKKVCPSLIDENSEHYLEVQTIGNCYIHPTAEIHPEAVIGPNVSIGAYAKISDGCRIINSLILEDAEIQAHTVVINSMIGWNAKVGPWCRIEGTLHLDDRSKYFHGHYNSGQKFDVSVLGVGVVVDPEVMLKNCLVMPFIKIKSNNANRILF
eukprot:403367277